MTSPAGASGLQSMDVQLLSVIHNDWQLVTSEAPLAMPPNAKLFSYSIQESGITSAHPCAPDKQIGLMLDKCITLSHHHHHHHHGHKGCYKVWIWVCSKSERFHQIRNPSDRPTQPRFWQTDICGLGLRIVLAVSLTASKASTQRS